MPQDFTGGQFSEWPDEYEVIMKELKAKSFVNMWLQSKSASYYSHLNNILNYPLIVCNSISGATLFSTDVFAVRVVVGVISLLSVIVMGVNLEVKPGEKCDQHFTVSKRYNNLIRNIDMTLTIPKKLRNDPDVFLDKITSELDDIAETEKTPPQHIITLFEKKYGSLDRILYGEELVLLLKEELANSKILKKLEEHKKTDEESILDPSLEK